MKTGRNLQDLATELDRQSKSKKDYLADTWGLKLKATGTGLVLEGVNGGMPLKPIAHQQLGSVLGIPKPYYDRLLANAPDLLARNVNYWFENSPAKKLVRTLDGSVRAILSDHFRPLDNIDLAEAILPKLQDLHATVVSGEITDSRLYIKAVTDRIQGEVKKGDVIQAGIVVSNSEIGHGALRIEELDYRLVCLNGMICESAVRKAHLGRSSSRGEDLIEDAREFFKDDTQRADDVAFFLKVRDAADSMFDPQRFNRRLLKYQEASTVELPGVPAKVVELIATRFSFTDGERASVLKHLIKGGDLSSWGLANAVTRAAQDAESYDRSYEMEAVGGKVIELPASAWKINK